MARGIVKWFNNTKKFGFILAEDGREIFVHFSEILSEGYKTLRRGEIVEYEIEETPRGAKAVRVVRFEVPRRRSARPAREPRRRSA